jgi:ABC-type dipeptide/oligopeptide/nickel transport system permease component
MLRYTLQRIALALAIVFFAISALYAVMITLPGDPTTVLLGPARRPRSAPISARGWGSTTRSMCRSRISGAGS